MKNLTSKLLHPRQNAPPEEREPTIAEQIDALTDPSFMTSLARGLAVVQAFSDSRKPQTIAQISQKTGIPRAAVRRCLHTCSSSATSTPS
jgi:IclR family pca regulon transcriptional regulator